MKTKNRKQKVEMKIKSRKQKVEIRNQNSKFPPMKRLLIFLSISAFCFPNFCFSQRIAVTTDTNGALGSVSASRFISANGLATSNEIANLSAAALNPNILSGNYTVVAIGDSMTQGYSSPSNYPAIFSEFTGKPVVNAGVGGQTSSQIAARMGAIPTACAVFGGYLFAGQQVTITFATGLEPVTSFGPSGGVIGSIGGAMGNAVWTSGSTALFTPFGTNFASGTNIMAVGTNPVPFVVSVTNQFSGGVIIFAGRNDLSLVSTVESNITAIAAMISNNPNYLILAECNATNEPGGSANWQAMTNLNGWLSRTFGPHFLNQRLYLQTQTNGSQMDTDFVNADMLPASLYATNAGNTIHLNTNGDYLLGKFVAGYWMSNFDGGATINSKMSRAAHFAATDTGTLHGNPIGGRSVTALSGGITNLAVLIETVSNLQAQVAQMQTLLATNVGIGYPAQAWSGLNISNSQIAITTYSGSPLIMCRGNTNSGIYLDSTGRSLQLSCDTFLAGDNATHLGQPYNGQSYPLRWKSGAFGKEGVVAFNTNAFTEFLSYSTGWSNSFGFWMSNNGAIYLSKNVNGTVTNQLLLNP
jgi:hypothetical protein